MFDPGQMAHDHRAADSDRLLTASLMGAAKRHAPWREPTQDETDTAVAELREIAGDRPDLLAEVAGILLGASEGELDEPRAKAAASFCIAAGADESLIPEWIGEGPPPGRNQAQASVQRPCPAYTAPRVTAYRKRERNTLRGRGGHWLRSRPGSSSSCSRWTDRPLYALARRKSTLT